MSKDKVEYKGKVIEGFNVRKKHFAKGSEYTTSDKGSYDYLVLTNKIK